MRPRLVLVLSAGACALWVAGGVALQRHMSVDEVRPGMVGIGRTVFQGTALEDFTVHILGVLRNSVGPQRDLILARLEGGPLAKAGVIAGMSGSPVYIDGRLIGAISYSLGAFPTEPIAGITPIGEMIEATEAGSPGPTRVPPVPMDATPAAFLATLQSAIRRPLGFAAPGAGTLGPTGPIDPRLIASLTPIATPVSFGALGDAAVDQLLGALGPAGFIPVPRVAQSGLPPGRGDGELRPGDPLGVEIVGGDLSVAATGTVTDVEGSRVYAFGHAFFNLGTARLPMTRAYVHTVLPSLMSSTKVTSTGDIIGTIVQDRVTAVAGTLGITPETVPVSLTIRTPRGASRTLEFALADDPLLTPLFTYAALLSAFGSYERQMGAATYAIRTRLTIRNRGVVEYDDVLTGESASTSAAATVAVPVAGLMTNDIEPVRVERVDLDVATLERPNVATIRRAWLDSTDVRPGRPVPLKVHLRTWRGEDMLQTVPIDIPTGAAGPLTLLVADAQRLTQWEQRDIRPVAPAISIEQLLDQLKHLRRNNTLYVRLYTLGAGAVVDGKPMPALPSSVLTVLQGDRAGGGVAMQSVVLGSWDIPMGQAVSGMRTLPVPNVRSGRRP
ncbi:MAG: SpoIVB peptidase S55 domain-containing protein [Acidobacteriota bacterium]